MAATAAHTALAARLAWAVATREAPVALAAKELATASMCCSTHRSSMVIEASGTNT